jgi:hypothetical protein
MAGRSPCCAIAFYLKRTIIREIEQEDLFKNIPIYLSRYGCVWKENAVNMPGSTGRRPAGQLLKLKSLI